MKVRNIALTAVWAAAVAGAACEVDFRPGTSDRPIPVRVEVVAAERTRPILRLPVVIEPAAVRSLAFQYGGEIARIAVARGDRVEPGDVLASLDLAALERGVVSSRSAAIRTQERVARSALRTGRRQQLFALASGSGIAAAPTSIEPVLTEAEARDARARLAAAEARLAAGVLHAPVAGIVDRIYRRTGDFASPDEPIVRLSEFSEVVARAELPRVLRALAREGESAEVRVGERARVGVLRTVAAPAATRADAVWFEVAVENRDLALNPGEIGEVAVFVPGSEAIASVPLHAVQRGIDAQPFAFVVAEEGLVLRAELRPIRLGGLDGDRVLVTAGLAAGERVVVSGYELLTVGDCVTVVGEAR